MLIRKTGPITSNNIQCRSTTSNNTQKHPVTTNSLPIIVQYHPMTFNNLSTLVQTVQHKPGLGVVSDWPERLFGFHCSTIQTSVLETWWLTASTSNITSMFKNPSLKPVRTQNTAYLSASITSLKMEIEGKIQDAQLLPASNNARKGLLTLFSLGFCRLKNVSKFCNQGCARSSLYFSHISSKYSSRSRLNSA